MSEIKLKVLQQFTAMVTTDFDEEADVATEVEEVFNIGDILEVEILDSNPEKYTEIQFADGSMVYQLPKNLFEVVPPNEPVKKNKSKKKSKS